LSLRFTTYFTDLRPTAQVIHLHAWSSKPFVPDPSVLTLMIVDDYDENMVLDDTHPKPWVVASSQKNVHILYVTRAPLEQTHVSFQIPVPPLTAKEVAQFIRRQLPVQWGKRPEVFLEEVLTLSAGNPRAALQALTALARGDIAISSGANVLDPVQGVGLFDCRGRPLSENSTEYEAITTDIAGVTTEFLHYLAAQPTRLYTLTSRQFEEVVAELLFRLGYDVTLTPASKDGGKDIYAAKKDAIGSFLYLIECKKFAPEHPVGVGVVRQLYAVAQLERATAAVLATTSFFTRGARDFQRELKFQISLQDFFAIQHWFKVVGVSDA
jgi:restriction system protein